jgi:hypothetical protein
MGDSPVTCSRGSGPDTPATPEQGTARPAQFRRAHTADEHLGAMAAAHKGPGRAKAFCLSRLTQQDGGCPFVAARPPLHPLLMSFQRRHYTGPNNSKQIQKSHFAQARALCDPLHKCSPRMLHLPRPHRSCRPSTQKAVSDFQESLLVCINQAATRRCAEGGCEFAGPPRGASRLSVACADATPGERPRAAAAATRGGGCCFAVDSNAAATAPPRPAAVCPLVRLTGMGSQ